MKLIDTFHDRLVIGRRARVLSARIAEMLPPDVEVLDVGCGSGLLASLVGQQRPDVQIRGIDVLIQPNTHIPVQEFDGEHFPQADKSVDVVTFVDVLHHTIDPLVLLREASRVSRKWIIIKDHLQEGILARQTLRLMDFVGNSRFDVALPYNYWPRQKWKSGFESIGAVPEEWSERLNIYWWPLRPLFERTLHFMARLEIKSKR